MMQRAVESFAMRTTIDLPERDHQLFVGLARARRTSLSKIIVELARRGLSAPASSVEESRACYQIDPVTGLAVFSSGRPITIEDVKALEDDE
jgi:hypothetical protein